MAKKPDLKALAVAFGGRAPSPDVLVARGISLGQWRRQRNIRAVRRGREVQQAQREYIRWSASPAGGGTGVGMAGAAEALRRFARERKGVRGLTGMARGAAEKKLRARYPSAWFARLGETSTPVPKNLRENLERLRYPKPAPVRLPTPRR